MMKMRLISKIVVVVGIVLTILDSATSFLRPTFIQRTDSKIVRTMPTTTTILLIRRIFILITTSLVYQLCTQLACRGSSAHAKSSSIEGIAVGMRTI